jgi:hypothetical protein
VSEDRSTAIERGLTRGHSYAQEHADDRASLGRIARAHSAAAVEASVDAAVVESLDLDDPVAFWSGFAHGVGRFLLEEGVAHLDPTATEG